MATHTVLPSVLYATLALLWDGRGVYRNIVYNSWVVKGEHKSPKVTITIRKSVRISALQKNVNYAIPGKNYAIKPGP